VADRLTIDIQDQQLQATLAEAIDRLARPRELMDLVGATLEAAVAMRLDDTKTDPAGQPWADLKDSTKKTYQRKYKGDVPGSLLDRYGLSHGGSGGNGLRKGLTHNVIDDTTVEVGFDALYAIFHEFGTRNMDRRGLLSANPGAGELGDEDRADVLDVVDRYLRELL
jgi:phage gpG-like protein